MDSSEKDLAAPITWKKHLFSAIKFLVTFYIVTLCMAIFFIHRGNDWVMQGILMGVLYLFVIVVSIKQMIKNLPMAAIILAALIVTLGMLIIVVTMIPLLRFFR